MTTPRPPSLVTEFRDLRSRLRVLEATRRTVQPDPTTYLADDAGNVVVSADGIAGTALGRPWLPVPFAVAYGTVSSTTGWPTTTSGTFVDLFYASHQAQHRYVMLDVDVVTGAATTAEVQLLDGATVIGQVLTVDAASTVRLRFTAMLITPYTAETVLHVQARRTAGASSVAMQVAGAWGVQTPLA